MHCVSVTVAKMFSVQKKCALKRVANCFKLCFIYISSNAHFTQLEKCFMLFGRNPERLYSVSLVMHKAHSYGLVLVPLADMTYEVNS